MTDSALVICDFSGNPDKFERHLSPLSTTADVTLVSLNGIQPIDSVTIKSVPSMGFRPLGLFLLFPRALMEVIRHDYDLIVSFSLLPHGVFALIVGRLSRTPVHLGIIGIDLDVHAKSWYRRPITSLIRRFDVVTVPGSIYVEQLLRIGVSEDSIYIMVNPVDTDVYAPPRTDTNPEYDFLWIGRLTPEKDPLLFIESLAELRKSTDGFSALMVGDGPLRSEVERTIENRGLDELIDRPGWIEHPVPCYHDARIFVLTSRRDALPLTLVEAMATGLASVVPDVGNVTDLVIHDHNGILVGERSPPAFSSELHRLLTNPDLRQRIRNEAPQIRTAYSYDSAAEDWSRILSNLEPRQRDAVPADGLSSDGIV